MRIRRLMAGLALLSVTRGVVRAQQVQEVGFGPPTGSVAQGFTRLGGVRELDRTRVVVLDAGDRSVYLADFAARRAAGIGRQGQGPGEYLQPIALLAQPNQRTLVQDPRNARFLELGPDGAVARAWAPAAPSLSRAGPWSTDSRGRFYYEESPKGGGGVLGMAAIVRLELQPTGARYDTLATMELTEAMQPYAIVSEDKSQVTFRQRVWAPRWQWAVSEDGRVALLEPEPYRVGWLDGARRTMGPVVPVTPVRVTAADRESYLASIGRPIRVSGGGGGKQEAPPEFPEEMPPFVGQAALYVAPDGLLWVERAASLADPVRRYDVFDGSGRLVARVSAPPRRRLIGFGTEGVYLALRDEDDVEILERYRNPVHR